MEITSVLAAGHLVATVLGQLARRSQPAEPVADEPGNACSPPSEPTSGQHAELRKILARYDVTDISPREFSEMLHELHQTGALTDEQFQELSRVRCDLDRHQFNPDEPLNLLEFYTDKLAEVRGVLGAMDDSAGFPSVDSAELAGLQRRLAWLEKLAALCSVPDAIELDQLA